MSIEYKITYKKDIELSTTNTWYKDLDPLARCACGGQPHIDVSKELIVCDNCGLSFGYRYCRGVVPYYTWQLRAKRRKHRWEEKRKHFEKKFLKC